MRWSIELYGERREQIFDSPVEAAKFAAATWPDVPEAVLANNDADDTLGWIVVAVQNGDSP